MHSNLKIVNCSHLQLNLGPLSYFILHVLMLNIFLNVILHVLMFEHFFFIYLCHFACFNVVSPRHDGQFMTLYDKKRKILSLFFLNNSFFEMINANK